MLTLAALAWIFGPSWQIIQRGIVSISPGKGAILLLAPIVALALLFAAFHFVHSEAWRLRWQRMQAAFRAGFRINAGTITALGLAFAIHLLNFLIVFLFAQSLGISVTFLEILLILPVVFLFLLLPVTVNGHGLREVLLIFYFTEFHIHLASGTSAAIPEIVVSLTLLCVANDLLWSLPGGLLALLGPKPKT